MSTSEAADQVAPSYGENQDPEVEAQEESVTTPVPSRLRTVSRVLQALQVIIGMYPLLDGNWTVGNEVGLPAYGDPVREQVTGVASLGTLWGDSQTRKHSVGRAGRRNIWRCPFGQVRREGRRDGNEGRGEKSVLHICLTNWGSR